MDKRICTFSGTHTSTHLLLIFYMTITMRILYVSCSFKFSVDQQIGYLRFLKYAKIKDLSFLF